MQSDSGARLALLGSLDHHRRRDASYTVTEERKWSAIHQAHKSWALNRKAIRRLSLSYPPVCAARLFVEGNELQAILYSIRLEK